MLTDIERLATAMRRLAADDGVRIDDGELRDAQAARAFNELAAELDATRQRARRHDELQGNFQAFVDVLLAVAHGQFGRRAPRDHSGDTADVLAFLINSTADEVQEMFTRLEREHAQLQRAQAQLIAVEKDAALGRLAAGVAHEVNQPLTVIMSLLDMLVRGADAGEDRRQQWLKLMQNATGHIAQIVDGVRTFGRPTPFELRATAALQPLRRARTLVASDLAAAEIHVKESIDDGLPALVANGERLQQVFINVMLNARDAMVSAATVEPTLAIDVTQGDGHVVYRFADNGPGASEADRERLFEPFFTTKHDRGTGLGLSVSQGIVREHGGTVRYEVSELGGGCFVVAIPCGAEA